MVDRMLIGGACTLTTGFVGLFWLDQTQDTLRADVVPQTIIWFLVAFAGFAIVLARTQSTTRATSSTSPQLATSAMLSNKLSWLLVLGVILRLLMVATEPTLSDDVYRYLWEGHLVTEGVSPYSFAIDSALGEPYDIAARGLANNTSLGSPYLPVAHGIFGAAAFVLPSEPWTMQLLMVAFDVLGVAMIIKLLRVAGLPEARALLYWLNPLVILEVGHGAHLDAIIVGVALAGIWLTLRPIPPGVAGSILARYGGPALLAAATLTRPLALLFMPVLFWLWTWRQRVVWAVVVALPVLLAGAAAGFGLDDSGIGVFGSARSYSETFRFNTGIYHWIETWVSGRGLDDRGWNEPMALTRLLVVVLVAVSLGAVFLVARRNRDLRATLRLLAVPIMIYVLLTPVLHPWYVLLLLAFLPFLAPASDEPAQRWVVVAPWLGLSALLIFSYLTYEDPDAFAERPWVRNLEWYPTLGLLLASAILGNRFPAASFDHATRDETIRR